MEQSPKPILLYVALLNKNGLTKLIEDVSGRPVGRVQSIKQLAHIAEKVGQVYGDAFYKGIAEIHPDKPFIISALSDDEETSMANFSGLAVSSRERKSQYSNACGCSIMSNADGSTNIKPCGEHEFKYATGATPAPAAKQDNAEAGKTDHISVIAILAIVASVGLFAYGMTKNK
jgi:hypothetical protein